MIMSVNDNGRSGDDSDDVGMIIMVKMIIMRTNVVLGLAFFPILSIYFIFFSINIFLFSFLDKLRANLPF